MPVKKNATKKASATNKKTSSKKATKAPTKKVVKLPKCDKLWEFDLADLVDGAESAQVELYPLSNLETKIYAQKVNQLFRQYNSTVADPTYEISRKYQDSVSLVIAEDVDESLISDEVRADVEAYYKETCQLKDDVYLPLLIEWSHNLKTAGVVNENDPHLQMITDRIKSVDGKPMDDHKEAYLFLSEMVLGGSDATGVLRTVQEFLGAICMPIGKELKKK